MKQNGILTMKCIFFINAFISIAIINVCMLVIYIIHITGL